MIITINNRNIEISDADYAEYVNEAREYVNGLDEELLSQELLIHEDEISEYVEYCFPQYNRYYATDTGYLEYLLSYWQKELYVNYIQARMNINSDTGFEDEMGEDDRPRDGEDEMGEEEADEMNELAEKMKIS